MEKIMNNQKHTLERKDIIISTQDDKRIAKIKNSSFLISASGKNDEEAIYNLNKVYKEFIKRLENCD